MGVSEKHLSGIERFLRDLRAGDRRTGERRSDAVSAARERRMADRRARDRRDPKHERFSLAMTAQIQAMVIDPSISVECPECEGHLLLGPASERNDVLTRRVQCTGCRRTAVVRADLVEDS